MKNAVKVALVGAALSLVLGSAPAHAMFVLDNNDVGDKLMLKDNSDSKGVTSFNGTVITTDDVAITTTGAVNIASGFSTIKPIKDGSLTELVFTPVDGNAFDSFSFRGQFLDLGKVTLTVQDNQDDSAQTFSFDVTKKNADLGPFGIIATPLSGETINSIMLSFADGFKEAKQFEFDQAGITANVPEPSTWAMMILGFVAIGAMTYRRRKSAMVAA